MSPTPELAPTPSVEQPAEIRLAGADQQAAWDRFVTSHQGASFCQLYGWTTVAERAYGKRSYALYATRDGEWVGVLPLVWMKGRFARSRLVSMPFLDQGGILARSEASAQSLWRSGLELAQSVGAGGLDLRGWVPGAEPSEITRRFLWTLSLGQSLEDLWRRIGPKVRNQIRKSEKLGLETRKAEPVELDRFYALFARNMRDIGSPVHSISLFREIFDVFPERSQLYLTLDRTDTPVAGAVAFTFRGTVTVPWASSRRSVRPTCPNHSLYWRILRDAQAGGASTFDFGRSTRGTGTARFKGQWGTDARPLTWICCDRGGEREDESYLDPSTHSALTKVWRRLPLSFANQLGPVIRGRLPQ